MFDRVCWRPRWCKLAQAAKQDLARVNDSYFLRSFPLFFLIKNRAFVVYCVLYTVIECALKAVYCALRTVYCVLFTVYCIYCVLYTVSVNCVLHTGIL